MAKISIPFFTLPEMNLKLRYEMIGPSSFCKESWLLQNDSPSKKHAFYKMAWLTRKMSLQNASFC